MYNMGMNELNLSSRAWFLWNNSWGREVFDGNGEGVGREADTPMEVASLTKIMTAMVVLEQRNLDEEVAITEEMLAGLEEFAVIGLQVGQVATVEDLLYATMLPSAGDAAQALAISTSGSIEGFVRLMNQQAASLGMTRTHFSNPVGFDWWETTGAEETSDNTESLNESETVDTAEIRNYSTARDVAMMLSWALNDERFREIFESFEKELPSIGRVARKTFGVSGAGSGAGASGATIVPGTGMIKGGKTGFTNAAGRCLASTAKIEGTEYILVTLGAPAEGTGHLEDAAKVYAAVEAEYEPVRLVTAGDVLVRVPVEGSFVKSLEFRAGQDFVVALPNDFRVEDLKYSFDGYKGQTAVRRDTVTGEPFGWWKIEYNGDVLYKSELVAQDSCESTENCVEMPEFYNYGWVALGATLTVALAGLTILGFWKRRRSERKSKLTKVAPWICLVMAAVCAIVCGLVFGSWFAPAGEVEVMQPSVTRVLEDGDTEEGGEETPGEDPNESSGGDEGVDLAGGNCTTSLRNLMLINPNFTVGTEFITARRGQLISVSQAYGIQEYHVAGNGDNLMIPEAAEHLNEMLTAYRTENPGHEMGTYSCFRAVGTTCGRLCAATGASDHHTGLTCDLIDLQYGSVLNTDDYPAHLEWQWLRANSYKYGFIDRFPEEWAGGSMSEPLNVDANGSTGLFETWHYRYVGVTAATEIATGKYNNGRYDSLEHYLKATGRVQDLKGGACK